MRKTLLTLAALLSVGFTISCQESRDSRFEREAKEYTERQCPFHIDAYTTIDSLVFNRYTQTETYHYTIDADSEAIALLKKQEEDCRKQLLSRVRNSVELKNAKEANITIAYHYHLADSEQLLFQFAFTPDDYK